MTLLDEPTVKVDITPARPRPGRRRRLIVRALVALLAIVAVGFGTWAVWFSDLLAAERVEVTGTSYLAPVQVRAQARTPLGRPLARVNLEAIRARVSSLPAVAEVRVSRGWPHTVRIQVRERVAVAVVSQSSGFDALAADGVIFRHYADRPAGLPVVQDEGADRDGLREAATVVGALPPDLLARVDHVSVRTMDEIRLTLRSGRTVVWGSAAASDQKAEVLAVLLKQPGNVLDVSVPGRPTTK